MSIVQNHYGPDPPAGRKTHLKQPQTPCFKE